MLHSFFILLLIQLFAVVLGQKSQPLSFVDPSAASLTQCATIPIQWNGGVPPFSLVIGTVDGPNSTFESVEDTPTVSASPSDWIIDFPSGTSFTISVGDSTGASVQSGVLTVLPSTNASCLEDSTDSSPPDISSPSRSHDPANSKTSQTVSQFTTSSPRPSTTSSDDKPSTGASSKRSHTGVIAGSIAAAVAVIIAITIFLIIYLKRRRRLNRPTSRENVARTFGNETAGFDGDEDPSLIADPFVYKPALTSEVSLNDGEPRRNTTGSSIPPLPVQVSVNQASRKGGTYLPTIHVTPPNDGPSPRMQEDDIERLAARMVAMMSAGRMSDQAWSPNKAIVDDDEDLSAPPVYNEVSRTNQ